jgi:hypothetical protein
MVTTPRPIIDSVVRSVCGRDVERLVPLTGGGMNETYRVELASDVAVVRPDRASACAVVHRRGEAHGAGADVGVPTPEVLGLKQLEHRGELLSFSIQRFLQGRSLEELIGELPTPDLERLVMDAGELLARVHSVIPDYDHGIRHELRSPEQTRQ